MSPRKSILKAVPDNSGTESQFINLDQISIMSECRHRDLNSDHVEQMMAALEDGRFFPKGKAVSDGKNYWLYDGFHQFEARKQLKQKSMELEIVKGDFREAQWRSFRANLENVSLPRTKADLMRIAQTIYSDPEWKKMSRSAIATHTGIRESRLRDWEKRKLLDQRNVADQSGRFTVTTVSGNERTYTKEKLVRTSQKPEPVAAARIAPSNPSLETSIEEIIPDYAPNFPKPEFFQVRPEDIPERGTFQTIGRHHVYVGDAGDRRFQEDLVQSFALAFVSIPYGWTDWNYEWVWDIANVVAVLVEEPLALYTFCRETAMEFQSALFTNFENKPAWVGLYARNELDDLDNGVKGSADLLLRGLTLLHAPRSADQILVINRPTIPFHPIISIEEAGRELWLADQDQMAISREIRNFQIGFATK